MSKATPSKQCPICGETVTLEKGQTVQLRAHYKTKHAEIYRWRNRVKLTIALAGIVSLVFVPLVARFGQTFTILSIVGILVLLFFIANYGDRHEKRLRKSWLEQHENQANR